MVLEPKGPLPHVCTRDPNYPWAHFTAEDLKRKLKELNPNKSQGPDNIHHTRLLTELANQLTEPLLALFNISLAARTVPEPWKEAFVTAVHKKGAM